MIYHLKIIIILFNKIIKITKKIFSNKIKHNNNNNNINLSKKILPLIFIISNKMFRMI
jgi:hypothetical protein